MAHFTVEVDGVDRTFREFRRDLHRGMEKSVERLADTAKEEGRQVLELHDRIFNREVFRKFRYIEVKSNPSYVRGKLVNYADHAGAVEHGVSPAEYADGGPPIQALMPWVKRKMGGWSLDTGGNGGGSNGSGNSSLSKYATADSPWEKDYNDGGNVESVFKDGDLYEKPELKPQNFESGDVVRAYLSDRYGGRDYVIDEVTDEKITFRNRNYEYHFDGSADEYDVFDVAKKHVPNVDDLQEDEQLIVDGDEVGPDAWDGENVYVVIDRIDEYDDGYHEIVVHDINGGWSGVSVSTTDIITHRPTREASWDIRDAERGQVVEYWNPEKSRVEEGWFAHSNDVDKQWQANQNIYIRSSENEYSNTKISSEQVLSVYDRNRENITKEDAPDHNHLDNDNISEAGFYDVEGGKRYLLWHKQDKKFINATAKRQNFGKAQFRVGDDHQSRVTAYDDEDFDRGINDVEVIGEYDGSRGIDEGIPLDEDKNNQLFYGQQVTIERDGETDEAVVRDWDKDTVYLGESDLADTAERLPNAIAESTITDVQDWNTLSLNQKREQVRSEILYRVDGHTIHENFDQAFADWMADDWFQSLKDPENARDVVTHIENITDDLSGNTAGHVSKNSFDKNYFEVAVKGVVEDGEFDGLKELTAHHELGHALLIRNRLRHNEYDLVNKYVSNFPGNLAFNEDGSVDTSQLGSDDFEHSHLQGYLIKDEGNNHHLNPTDFSDVDPLDGFSDADNLASLDYDEFVGAKDLFDPDDPAISPGDVVHYRTSWDKEKYLIYTGSSTSSGDDNEWDFVDTDSSFNTRITTESDGAIEDGEILGYKEDDYDFSRSEFTPSYDDDLRNMAAASNHSMKQQLWTIQHDDTQYNRNSHADNILRPYTTMNGHETVAGLVSILQSDSYAKVQELRTVKEMHPGLLKTFLQVYNPSDTAVSYLEQYDDLEGYL